MSTRADMPILLWALGGLALTGCAGLGPTAAEFAAHLPPVASLDEQARQAVHKHTEAALSHLEAGEYVDARRAADEAIALDGRAARARAIRGRCLMEQARAESPPILALWHQAEGELLLASHLQPADAEIALLHARFFEADGHLSKAVDILDGILEHAPSHPACLRLAADLHYELGEERAALPLLDRVLELEPRDPVALYRRAHCRLRLAMTSLRESRKQVERIALFESAVAGFAAYREVVPRDAEAYAGEANARLGLARLRGETPDPVELAEVVRLCRRASQLSRVSPEPEFNLGVALELVGEGESARQAYERALKRDPEHLPSLLNLAANLAGEGRRSDAARYCRRALRLGVTSEERRQLQAFLQEQ